MNGEGEDHAAVVRALIAWEASAGSNDHMSVERLATLMNLQPNEVISLARTVRRLVQAGFLDAHDVTTMGSPYPQYMITGVTLAGQREVSRGSHGVQPVPSTVNINVYGGTVASVNLGQVIGNIETQINAAAGSGADDLRAAVKEIVESLERDSSITESARAETLQQFEYLAEAAATPPAQRRLSIIKSVVQTVGATMAAAAEAHTAWNTWLPTIRQFFGL